MTACIGKTVVSVIFVAAADVNVFVPVAFLILVQLSRPNLGDKTPYEVFASLYGEEILKMMDVELIPPDKVTLRPSLLK